MVLVASKALLIGVMALRQTWPSQRKNKGFPVN